MALIQCMDCESPMSDAASACPACGARAPRSMVLAAEQEPCGACLAAERTGAFVCPGCGASKGHMMSGGAYGNRLKAAGGVIAPAVIAALFLPVGYVLLPLALLGLHRLVRSRTEQTGV